MPAPSPRTSTYAVEASAASVVGAEPSGAAENDILFMVVQWWRQGGPTITTNPASNGWTSLVSLTGDVDQGAQLYWRRRGSSALTTTERTFGLSSNPGWIEMEIIAISGAITTGNPWDDLQSSTQADRASPDGPSATSAGTERLALVIGWTWAGAGSGGASAPSGYTITRSGTVNNGVLSATKAIGAGAEDPGVFGNVGGTDATVATTVILTPAASGGAVGPAFRRSQIMNLIMAGH